MNNKFDNTKVKELTNKDYEIKNGKIKIKNNKKKGLVVFYYYWCGYCNLIAPELIKLSEKNDINVYAIHGENPKNKKAFETLNIQGVPHIRKITKTGIISNIFNGERNVENFYNFIQKGGSSCNRKKSIKKGGSSCNSKKPVKKGGSSCNRKKSVKKGGSSCNRKK